MRQSKISNAIGNVEKEIENVEKTFNRIDKRVNMEMATLKVGDWVIFHEEGTVSFVRCGTPFRFGVFSDDKFYLDKAVMKNEILISSIADLIATSHRLSAVREKSFIKDHLVFKFIKGGG